RDGHVTGVQTCALPISEAASNSGSEAGLGLAAARGADGGANALALGAKSVAHLGHLSFLPGPGSAFSRSFNSQPGQVITAMPNRSEERRVGKERRSRRT